MPRLTNVHYLNVRSVLRHTWFTDKSAFGLVTTADQRRLHDYFRPSDDLTDAEALAHRATVTTRHPSLPHSAGRALTHLAHLRQSLKYPTLITAGKRTITVRAVLRPRPDIKRLALALLPLAAVVDR